MIIRKATKKDTSALFDLYQAMWEELIEKGSDESIEDYAHNVSTFVVPSLGTDYPILVAEQYGEIIAALFWAKLGNKDVCLGLGTYVDPEYRGDGISNKLRDAGLAALKESGCKKLIVQWNKSNLKSGSWFAKCGLEESQNQVVSLDIK